VAELPPQCAGPVGGRVHTGARLPHVLVLAGFTIGFLLLAARRLRRNG
jgi:hypothetical protein